jgi:hypothetical protein
MVTLRCHSPLDHDTERLRGPQHDAAWCDEIAAWRYPETWDMLMFGLRLGADPLARMRALLRRTRAGHGPSAQILCVSYAQDLAGVSNRFAARDESGSAGS